VRPDAGFAGDIARIRRSRLPLPKNPWRRSSSRRSWSAHGTGSPTSRRSPRPNRNLR